MTLYEKIEALKVPENAFNGLKHNPLLEKVLAVVKAHEAEAAATKQKTFVVMIDDVDLEAELNVQECTVWSTKEKAAAHLKKVVSKYRKDCCAQYVKQKCVGFTEGTNKDYVMIKSKKHFTFYKNGYYNENHIEIWILEKTIDELT